MVDKNHTISNLKIKDHGGNLSYLFYNKNNHFFKIIFMCSKLNKIDFLNVSIETLFSNANQLKDNASLVMLYWLTAILVININWEAIVSLDNTMKKITGKSIDTLLIRKFKISIMSIFYHLIFYQSEYSIKLKYFVANNMSSIKNNDIDIYARKYMKKHRLLISKEVYMLRSYLYFFIQLTNRKIPLDLSCIQSINSYNKINGHSFINRVFDCIGSTGFVRSTHGVNMINHLGYNALLHYENELLLDTYLDFMMRLLMTGKIQDLPEKESIKIENNTKKVYNTTTLSYIFLLLKKLLLYVKPPVKKIEKLLIIIKLMVINQFNVNSYYQQYYDQAKNNINNITSFIFRILDLSLEQNKPSVEKIEKLLIIIKLMVINQFHVHPHDQQYYGQVNKNINDITSFIFHILALSLEQKKLPLERIKKLLIIIKLIIIHHFNVNSSCEPYYDQVKKDTKAIVYSCIHKIIMNCFNQHITKIELFNKIHTFMKILAEINDLLTYSPQNSAIKKNIAYIKRLKNILSADKVLTITNNLERALYSLMILINYFKYQCHNDSKSSIYKHLLMKFTIEGYYFRNYRMEQMKDYINSLSIWGKRNVSIEFKLSEYIIKTGLCGASGPDTLNKLTNPLRDLLMYIQMIAYALSMSKATISTATNSTINHYFIELLNDLQSDRQNHDNSKETVAKVTSTTNNFAANNHQQCNSSTLYLEALIKALCNLQVEITIKRIPQIVQRYLISDTNQARLFKNPRIVNQKNRSMYPNLISKHNGETLSY